MPSTSDMRAVAQLAAVLASEPRDIDRALVTSGHCADDALALRRIAIGVQRWALRECNGMQRYDAQARRVVNCWSDTDNAAKAKADTTARAKAQKIADRYGATVALGGDPRGYTLRLHLVSGRKNGGFGDGWGIDA